MLSARGTSASPILCCAALGRHGWCWCHAGSHWLWQHGLSRNPDTCWASGGRAAHSILGDCTPPSHPSRAKVPPVSFPRRMSPVVCPMRRLWYQATLSLPIRTHECADTIAMWLLGGFWLTGGDGLTFTGRWILALLGVECLLCVQPRLDLILLTCFPCLLDVL